MKRNTLNASVDAILAIAVLALLLTGLLIAFVLPPGTNRSLALWGLSRHDWGDVHLYLALAALLVFAVHATLHWTWVVTTVRRWFVGRGAGAPSRRLRVVSGLCTIVAVAALVGGLWWLASSAVEPRAGRDGAAPQAGAAPAAGAQERRRWRGGRAE